LPNSAILSDRVVLGHNAFFGVNHLSAVRGQETEREFTSNDHILEKIKMATAFGASGMMMSTHDKAIVLAELIHGDSALRSKLGIYPLLPYAQKYIRAANEKGLVSAVLDAASKRSVGDVFHAAVQGGLGLLGNDLNRLLASLIRMELSPFRKLELRTVFLHDILTDLILGLQLKSVAEFYLEETSKISGAVPGFATKNFPALVACLENWGLGKPPVLAHFNAIGFKMNPSRVACENAAATAGLEIMAMGTLASGHLAPVPAYSYLAGVPGIRSVVVGVSKQEHMEETFSAIKDQFAFEKA
jgi:hypothetical protein